MKWLAKFCDIEVIPASDNSGNHILEYGKIISGAGLVPVDNFMPLSWDFWMGYVEPRIRERDLWEDYLRMLAHIVTDDNFVGAWADQGKELYTVWMLSMQSTLEQRAEALKRVLEAQNGA